MIPMNNQCNDSKEAIQEQSLLNILDYRIRHRGAMRKGPNINGTRSTINHVSRDRVYRLKFLQQVLKRDIRNRCDTYLLLYEVKRK